MNQCRIDILLGVDVFIDVLLHGWRTGPPGTPVALETEFGWVLGGSTGRISLINQVNVHSTAFHTTNIHMSGDDILHHFWEIEESPNSTPTLSTEEHAVMQQSSLHSRRKICSPLTK